MTSPAQAAANRRNAQKSTGPRTAEGKARSAANALKHGLTAVRATLRCEDRAAWARLRRDLVARHQPEGEAEARLVDDLAFHYLRLGRLPLAEAGAWNAFGRTTSGRSSRISARRWRAWRTRPSASAPR